MRRTCLSVAIAVALAITCGVGADAVSRLVEPFASDIGIVLTAPTPRGSRSDADGLVEKTIVHVGGAPSGAGRGYQLALFGALIGGIPASVLAMVLAVRHKRVGRRAWSGRWATVFLAGFIFQLSSLVVAGSLTLLMLTIVWSAGMESLRSDEWLAMFLLADLACSAAALPSWRTMYLALAPAPLISIRS